MLIFVTRIPLSRQEQRMTDGERGNDPRPPLEIDGRTPDEWHFLVMTLANALHAILSTNRLSVDHTNFDEGTVTFDDPHGLFLHADTVRTIAEDALSITGLD
jgi:hypothetical protein